jgi:hypothetical protein
VFPNIKLVINNLDIRNVQYRDVLLRINVEKIEINLNLIEFLKKKMKINNVMINKINLIAEKNELPNFYIKKETVKKIVKLGEDEVFGVRDKLKTLLMGSDNKKPKIEDGYREIELEEDKIVELDNKKVKYMFVNLLNLLKINNFEFDNKLYVNFLNTTASIVKDNNNIQKEFKNIAGDMIFSKGLNETRLKINFMLNNVNGILDLRLKNIKDNFEVYTKLTNSQNDEIHINYAGNNLLMNTIDDVAGNFDVKVNSENFNNLVQWILSSDSEYYYRFDYKKAFKFLANINKDKNEYILKKLELKSDAIDLEGNISLLKNKDIFELNVNNLDFNEFIINLSKSKNIVNEDSILIFKINNFEDLIEEISKSKNEVENKDADFRINIKNMSKDGKNIKDSVVNFEIVNNNYRINDIKLTFDDMEVVVDSQENINDYYYNNLSVKGKDFKKIAGMFNFENLLDIDDFEMESKVIIYNNTVYLYDYKIKNENQEIFGLFEYSFDEEDNYIASKMNFNNLTIKTQTSDTKMLKEKFLWLNNFSKNVFLDLKIDNLTYNDIGNIYFKSKINYMPGHINFYDIERINFDKIKNIRGKVSLDIRKKSPVVNINLLIDEINHDINLVDYIFDVEKYKNILFKTEVNVEKQAKYWINKLFTIPSWDEINGSINLQIQNLRINDILLNGFGFESNIDNGLLNLHTLNFTGLGGNTALMGKIDLKTNKNIHLVLTDTIYNIEDILKLVGWKENDILKGTIGIGAIFTASGFNGSIFASSMNLQTKFVGKSLYIKKLGLTDLKEKLAKIYDNNTLLTTINPKDIILNNSGTIFDDFSGTIIISNGINDVTVEAKGNGISTKLVSKIDNTLENININIIDTSIIVNKVGDTTFPLYVLISFREDFSNKANLTINTSQIEEYLGKVRNNIKIDSARKKTK